MVIRATRPAAFAAWSLVFGVFAFVVGIQAARLDSASGASPVSAPVAGDADEIELFAAIDAGQIAVTVRPRDAHVVRVELQNKTGKPLRIRFPEGLAAAPLAAPVAAQFVGGPGGGNPFGNGNLFGNGPQANRPQGQPQALGMAIGAQGDRRGAANQGNLPGGVLFSVPAEKIVRVTLSSLCLEYGKREPNPRNAYVFMPLASVCDEPAVQELLSLYARGETDEQTAQLAAWQLTSGMTWEKMADMTSLRAYGKVEPVFDRKKLAAAKKLVERLPSAKKSPASGQTAAIASPNR